MARAKRQTQHLILVDERKTAVTGQMHMRCTACGEEFSVLLPCSLTMPGAIFKQFELEHRYCEDRRELQRFELVSLLAFHLDQFEDADTSAPLQGPPETFALAREDGQRFRDEVWRSDEMLRSGAAARRLNLSKEALSAQRQSRTVLGLTASEPGFRYPEWQFEDRVRLHVPELLSTLSHLDAWGHYLFFTQPEPLLGGRTPLSVLRSEQPAEVLGVARILAEEARDD